MGKTPPGKSRGGNSSLLLAKPQLQPHSLLQARSRRAEECGEKRLLHFGKSLGQVLLGRDNGQRGDAWLPPLRGDKSRAPIGWGRFHLAIEGGRHSLLTSRPATGTPRSPRGPKHKETLEAKGVRGNGKHRSADKENRCFPVIKPRSAGSSAQLWSSGG